MNTKVSPIINRIQSLSSSINTKNNSISNPIRFSFSKDICQQSKTSIYENLSRVSNDNLIKQQSIQMNPIRSTPMLNLMIQQQQQQQKIKSRFSSSNNYVTHYHDFDQPQE